MPALRRGAGALDRRAGGVLGQTGKIGRPVAERTASAGFACVGAVQPLSEALASVDTPAGRKRVEDVLASRPFPHYRQYAGQRGLLVRIDEDGTETVGRFVDRVFTAVGNGVANVSRELQITEAGSGKKKVARGSKDKSRVDSKAQKAWA